MFETFRQQMNREIVLDSNCPIFGAICCLNFIIYIFAKPPKTEGMSLWGYILKRFYINHKAISWMESLCKYGKRGKCKGSWISEVIFDKCWAHIKLSICPFYKIVGFLIWPSHVDVDQFMLYCQKGHILMVKCPFFISGQSLISG